MTTPLTPALAGTAVIHAPVPAFVHAFARRVEGGLHLGAAPARSRYEVTEAGPDTLRFRADNWLTAISVGLNEVEVSAAPGRVRYHVQYKRWAGYAVALGAAIGISLIATFLIFDLRGYLQAHRGVESLLLSDDQNVALAWGMAIFWGFAWPWILIALYKRPLRRMMEALIADVDATASRP
jgi:hypothetical protein